MLIKIKSDKTMKQCNIYNELFFKISTQPMNKSQKPASHAEVLSEKNIVGKSHTNLGEELEPGHPWQLSNSPQHVSRIGFSQANTGEINPICLGFYKSTQS